MKTKKIKIKRYQCTKVNVNNRIFFSGNGEELGFEATSTEEVTEKKPIKEHQSTK